MGRRLMGYVRVSTVDQNEARQVEEMERQGVLLENLYIDKLSGKTVVGRESFNKMLGVLEKGDTVIFHDFSRAARNLDDLRAFIKDMMNKGVWIKFVKEGICIEDALSPSVELILNILGSLAEFFRKNMLEAQAEGIAIAKREGKYKGGRGQLLSKADVIKIKEDIALGIPKIKIARNLKVHMNTLYLALERFDKGLCVDEVKATRGVLEEASAEKDVVKYFRRRQLLGMEKAKEVASMACALTKPTHEKIRLLLGANTDLTTHHIEVAAKYIMETKKKWAS